MVKFRTFSRTWWLDRNCTQPGAGRRRYDGHEFETEQAARDHCARENAKRTGCKRVTYDERGRKVIERIPNRGPYGAATEYERV